jgi:hypothetical protein
MPDDSRDEAVGIKTAVFRIGISPKTGFKD